ncbi:MAG TPA: methyltransferase [Terriglobia bacterium]|jgi:protein-S-isoprenylcysteine O-methyltransferase Ste14
MAQRLRVPIGFVIAAVVLYLAAPTRVSVVMGLPLAVLGTIFRGLAAGVIRKDAALATSGVYALTRNPLYFGSACLTGGFAIMSASWIAAALLLVPFLSIYPAVIAREQAHLQALFPEEFQLYKSRVPVFVPRPTLHFPRSFAFSQYLANREYNTALGFAAALVILVVKLRS